MHIYNLTKNSSLFLFFLTIAPRIIKNILTILYREALKHPVAFKVIF